jgi:molybdopterin molybdotransferase
MDGYACRSADVSQASDSAPVALNVVDDIRAGAFPSRDIDSRQAARVATGAPVPEGADTVIRVEDTDARTDRVTIRSSRDSGRNVRAAGEDVRAGEVALRAGTMLGAAQIALLASVGAASVSVHPRARVAIIATGDELVPLDQFSQVTEGKRIVSSNSYGLAAGIQLAGGVAVDFGIIRDDAAAIRSALERAAASSDLVVTSAGVSVGEADYLRGAVAELGGTLDFWRVQMRPGSPLAFGTVKGTPWLGLPGNPVSSLVTFELFARPAIRRLMGQRVVFSPRITVIMDDAVSLTGPLTHFLRVTLDQRSDGSRVARLAGPQPSNILSSLARADALLVLPPDQRDVKPGDQCEAILLGSA